GVDGVLGGRLPPPDDKGGIFSVPADGPKSRGKTAADVRGQPDRLPRRAGRRGRHRRPPPNPGHCADKPAPARSARSRQPGRSGDAPGFDGKRTVIQIDADHEGATAVGFADPSFAFSRSRSTRNRDSAPARNNWLINSRSTVGSRPAPRVSSAAVKWSHPSIDSNAS